jgi:hypothetical protein
MEIFDRLKAEWPMIRQAPWSFVSMGVIIAGLVWVLQWWRYEGTIRESQATVERYRRVCGIEN